MKLVKLSRTMTIYFFPLPGIRLHTCLLTNIKTNTATGLKCSCYRCRKDGRRASLGHKAPLALPQHASEVDILLLRRFAQKSFMSITERTVKVVDVSIHVKIEGFTPGAIVARKALSLFGVIRYPCSTFVRPKFLACKVQPDSNRNSAPFSIPKYVWWAAVNLL